MPAFNKFNAFIADVHNKIHNLGSDSLKIALSNVAPVAGNSVLADLTEIAYTNLSSRAVTTTSSTQSGGLYKLICNDLVLTASGAVATFRYIILYNDTPAGKNLIGWWDNGAPGVTMGNADTFTVDFSAANGVFQSQ